MKITTMQALRGYVTWLPSMAPFQMSFNKQYARMHKTICDKNAELEILSTYGLKRFTEDESFIYFSTDANIKEFNIEQEASS